MSDQASTSSRSPTAIQKLLDKERSRVAAKAKKEEKEKEADAKDLAASQKAFDDAQKKRFPIDFIYIQRRHLEYNFLDHPVKSFKKLETIENKELGSVRFVIESTDFQYDFATETINITSWGGFNNDDMKYDEELSEEEEVEDNVDDNMD
ncbi:hypothetical protein BV898_05277 [Hypsibius exemplaris]|uniref:Uncharacterized protein n=1 Tax=Hypsibius exemplaris TaxID=2072580 RepID=A0A1W0WZQ2_HYPEX|nr:hypothetical protein BV898_05277 [Hypsibius exemplaris]